MRKKVTITRKDGTTFTAAGATYQKIYNKLFLQNCFKNDSTGNAITRYVVFASGKTIDDYIIYDEDLDWCEYEKDEAAVMTGDDVYQKVIEHSAEGEVVWSLDFSGPYQEQLKTLEDLGTDICSMISAIDNKRDSIWDKYFPEDLPLDDQKKYDLLDATIDQLRVVLTHLEESYYILSDLDF